MLISSSVASDAAGCRWNAAWAAGVVCALQGADRSSQDAGGGGAAATNSRADNGRGEEHEEMEDDSGGGGEASTGEAWLDSFYRCAAAAAAAMAIDGRAHRRDIPGISSKINTEIRMRMHQVKRRVT